MADTRYSSHTHKRLVIELEIFLRSSKSVCIDRVILCGPMQYVQECIMLKENAH